MPAEVVEVVELAAVVVVVELGVVVAVVAAVVVEAARLEDVVVVPDPVLELLQLAANIATVTKAAPAIMRPDLKLPASFIIWTPYRFESPASDSGSAMYATRTDGCRCAA